MIVVHLGRALYWFLTVVAFYFAFAVYPKSEWTKALYFLAGMIGMGMLRIESACRQPRESSKPSLDD